MIRFTHVKYGILLAMVAILFGGSMGLSFGCCEDDVKGFLKTQADSVAQENYDGVQEKMDKVINKSWVYMKMAHLHSQTMGVIAIAFSLLVAWLNFKPKIQLGVSLLSGLGSFGYGIFWLLAALLAPRWAAPTRRRKRWGWSRRCRELHFCGRDHRVRGSRV